jgi:hypothetical protein
VGASDSRQVYLYVQGGTLEFAFTEAPSAKLDLLDSAAHVDGRITFQGAQGTLQTPDGPRDVAFADVALDGGLAAAMGEVQGSRFAATAAGHPTAALLAGQRIAYPDAVATVAANSGMSAWMLGVAVVAGAVALLAAAGLGRRRSLSRRMGRIAALMDMAEYRAAAAGANGALLRSRKHGTDAQVIRAVSLLRLERLPEAAAALEGWRGAQGAHVDYLWAFLHALRGEAALCRARITACLARDASMRDDIDANPAFAAILRPAKASVALMGGGYS